MRPNRQRKQGLVLNYLLEGFTNVNPVQLVGCDVQTIGVSTRSGVVNTYLVSIWILLIFGLQRNRFS